MVLVYLKKMEKLAYVYDGYSEDQDLIKSWSSDEEFIQLLSEQSDFSLSGCDPSSELYEKHIWYQNNQRITRSSLESFGSK